VLLVGAGLVAVVTPAAAANGPGPVVGQPLGTADPLTDTAAVDQLFAALGNAVDDTGLLWNDLLARST
jgi:hypothetical protein